MLAQLDQDSNLSWLFSPCWMKWMYIDDVGRWVTSCCGNGESNLTSVWILHNLRRAGGTLGKNRVFWSNWEISFKSQIIWTPPRRLQGKESQLQHNIQCTIYIDLYRPKIIYVFINQQKWSKKWKSLNHQKPPLQLRCADLSTARRGHLQDLCRVTAELFRHAAQQPLLAAETDGNARA